MPDESGGGGVPDEPAAARSSVVVVLAVGREVGRRTDNPFRATEAKDVKIGSPLIASVTST
jgi:hypothetical protein